MKALRLVLMLVLVISASPVPRCALALAATGDNCHATPTTGATANESEHAALAGGDLDIADIGGTTPAHDSSCACDVARPTSKAQGLVLPAAALAVCAIVPPTPIVRLAPVSPASATGSPAMRGILLPLLV